MFGRQKRRRQTAVSFCCFFFLISNLPGELLLRNVLSDIQRDRDVDDDTKGDPLSVRVDAEELQCCFQEFEDCNTDNCG